MSVLSGLGGIYTKMDKQDILNQYKKHEDKQLISKVLDYLNFSKTRNQIQNTDFLDLGQKNKVEKFLKMTSEKCVFFYGGFEKAERTMLIIYPQKLETLFYNEIYNYDDIMKIIRITLPNSLQESYEHRNYLSALMKIGIKREKIR